jgi:hypothetical protein
MNALRIVSPLLVLVGFADLACSHAGTRGAGGGSAPPSWDCESVAVPLGQTFQCVSSVAANLAVSGPAYYCAANGTDDAECPPIGAGGVEAPARAPSAPDAATNAGPDSGPSACASGRTNGTENGDGFYCTKEAGKRVCKRAPTCDDDAHRVQMDCEPNASSGLGHNGPTPASGSGYPGNDGSGDDAMTGCQTQCFYPSGTSGGSGSMPAATFEYRLEAIEGVDQLHVRLTFSPDFVDNSYGAGAIGWPSGHKFAELVGSDHAELALFDKASVEKLHFKLDYLSKSSSAPSGYACLGVSGGEGRMLLGDASLVTKAMSSLDRNLNERGYASFLVDSPATDAGYAPPKTAPHWDFRVVYEAWIENSAFASAGFGNVELAFVHASPSKARSNTLPVTPGPCPPDWGNGDSGSSTGGGSSSGSADGASSGGSSAGAGSGGAPCTGAACGGCPTDEPGCDTSNPPGSTPIY